jgi:hypothetical protein
MRAGTSLLINELDTPREVGLRAAFRKSLPVFTMSTITDSLGLTTGAWIDACTYGTGILRVTSVGNVLYTQYISNIHEVWPAWSNTGIALCPGSRPAVDAGYVWYQLASNEIRYRYYGTWTTENSTNGLPGATHLAPIANHCYAMWQRNAGAYEIVSRGSTESSQYTLYGLTSMPRLDAVSFGGKEYLYTMDRDAGRIIEIQHSGNAIGGRDSYGVGKSVIPIDAIDEVYGLKLGYAGVVDGKVVVTGRLTRTSDDSPVSMDIYSMGPEYFSLGREMFIGAVEANGKLLRVGDEFIVAGATRVYIAQATGVFGGTTHSSLQLLTSDFSNITLTEAEARSSNLDIDMSPSASHAAIAAGSDVELEMAYNGNWCKLATCNVEADRTTTDEQGKTRIVSGIGKSAKRLSQWSPDQGIYIPSQSRMHDYPANMTQVIRAAGQWESVDPESETSPLKLKDLNKLGVLYSTARASRGGAMRGKFYYPSDTYFKPYYGVGVNYYRESAAEAAERLGVEVDDLEDDMYGHNGLVAIHSLTEHTGGVPGVALYLWKDSTLTKLTSVSLSIPADTWHWLQMEFIEGEVRIKYRLDSNAVWTDILTYMYANATSPWKSDTLGRGVLVVKNVVPSTPSYGLGSDDMILAGNGFSTFPASGTVQVDNEQMTYSSMTGSALPVGGNTSYWDVSPFSLTVDPDPAYTSGTRVLAVEVDSLDGTDGKFNNMAVVFVSTNSNVGIVTPLYRTSKIVAMDGVPPRMWEPLGDFYSGWTNDKGDLTKGFWFTPGPGSGYAGIYVDQNPWDVIFVPEMPYVHPYTKCMMMVRRGLNLTARGANGTAATAHGPSTINLVTGKFVQVGIAASFSQDEDQSLEDAIQTIVRLAGGNASCQAEIDEDHVFSSAGVTIAYSDFKNFIATFDLPTLSDGAGVGVAFRNFGVSMVSGYPYAAGGGYYIDIGRTGTAYSLSLYNIANSGAPVLLERAPIRPFNTNGSATANIPVGTVKVSVQDSMFSVWLNGRYLHTFNHTMYATAPNMAFVSRQAATFHIHVSELKDLLADIVVGVRGNGMSVLSELLADRHIFWRDEPDGSMFFYRSRIDQGVLPDIVSAVAAVRTDTVVSRVRSEGLKISEVSDPFLLGRYGNTFVTMNARHANDVTEAYREAILLINEQRAEAMSRRLVMDVHPGLQPGDLIEWYNADPSYHDYRPLIVRSQVISIGFAGSDFVCEMQCDTVEQDA